jgi:hypothetical protein
MSNPSPEQPGELRDAITATLDHDVKLLGVEITDFQSTDMKYTDAFQQAVNNAAVQKGNTSRSSTSASRRRSRPRPRGSSAHNRAPSARLARARARENLRA